MAFISKRKKLSICLLALVLVVVIVSVYAIRNRGVIRVVFQPSGLGGVPLCIMTIHPDGRVIARAGEGILLFGAIPVFFEPTERRELTISQEDYEFLISVIYRSERPNLRMDTTNPRNANVTGGWLLRVSTTTRRHRFFGAFDLYGNRTIITEFVDKLYIICPFDLWNPFIDSY